MSCSLTRRGQGLRPVGEGYQRCGKLIYGALEAGAEQRQAPLRRLERLWRLVRCDPGEAQFLLRDKVVKEPVEQRNDRTAAQERFRDNCGVFKDIQPLTTLKHASQLIARRRVWSLPVDQGRALQMQRKMLAVVLDVLSSVD